MCKVIVGSSAIAGKGVFAVVPIFVGEQFLEFKGECTSKKEANKRLSRTAGNESSYVLVSSVYDLAIDPSQLLEEYGASPYVNHSRNNANARLQSQRYRCPETKRFQLRAFFVATRDIEKGEEIVFDYNDHRRQVVKEHPWLLQ